LTQVTWNSAFKADVALHAFVIHPSWATAISAIIWATTIAFIWLARFEPRSHLITPVTDVHKNENVVLEWSVRSQVKSEVNSV